MLNRFRQAIWLFPVIASCADGPQAPSADGAPFMSALIDRSPWMADSAQFTLATRTPTGYLSFSAAAASTGVCPCRSIIIGLANTTVGSFSLEGGSDGSVAGYQFSARTGAQPRLYVTDSNHTGTVRVAILDTVQHMATGTFAFRAIDSTTGTTVLIAAGRFRVRYVQQ